MVWVVRSRPEVRQMARVRSPNYPLLSLPEALQRVKTIHSIERHLAAPREVIAKHLGYSGLNGASIKVVSALTKYGLLDEVSGDKLRVSPLALSILYPKDDLEKASALQRAAYSPPLFAEIALEWEDGDTSDQNLRSYLVRRNFAEDAVDRVIQSYRETKELVALNQASYPILEEPKSAQSEEVPAMQASVDAPKVAASAVVMPLEGEDPYRLSFSKSGGIEVVGRLSDADTVDDLIKSLEALKGLLRN